MFRSTELTEDSSPPSLRITKMFNWIECLLFPVFSFTVLIFDTDLLFVLPASVSPSFHLQFPSMFLFSCVKFSSPVFLVCIIPIRNCVFLGITQAFILINFFLFHLMICFFISSLNYLNLLIKFMLFSNFYTLALVRKFSLTSISTGMLGFRDTILVLPSIFSFLQWDLGLWSHFASSDSYVDKVW